MQGAHANRRERRPGGGPERSEGIAASPEGLKWGASYATRFRTMLLAPGNELVLELPFRAI